MLAQEVWRTQRYLSAAKTESGGLVLASEFFCSSCDNGSKKGILAWPPTQTGHFWEIAIRGSEGSRYLGRVRCG